MKANRDRNWLEAAGLSLGRKRLRKTHAMRARKKPNNTRHLRLRRALAKMVSEQHQISLQLDRILRDMKRAGWIVEKTIRKIK